MTKRTKEWFVDGFATVYQNGKGKPTLLPRIMKKRFCVRYTSDKVGKSLSIADEKSGVMFQVPFDTLYEEIIGGKE